MAKKPPTFGCRECGATTGRWAGRCSACGTMNSIVELTGPEARLSATGHCRSAGGSLPRQNLAAIGGQEAIARCNTGLCEFDRVLGGGLPAGAAIVLGGAPGVGKSTLLAQCCGHVARTRPVLYVTAEESVNQVRDRCLRVGVAADCRQLDLAASSDADEIVAAIRSGRQELVVIDSIQLLRSDDIDGLCGSPSQVRGCATRLVEAAKAHDCCLIIVGHVTKDGTLAGPRLLEHLVDTVLSFEATYDQAFRGLRAVKNRFGSTDELALFTMDAQGLHDVDDPAGAFIEHRDPSIAGSCVVPVIEGQRALLVEVQALVAPSDAPQVARRVSGCDANRVQMIIAVLSRRTGLALGHTDIFVNVTGGVQIREPAADLAIAGAIASAYHDQPIPADLALIGEVGLGGELRPASRYELRAGEARRLGFQRLIGPGPGSGRGRIVTSSLATALQALFQERP